MSQHALTEQQLRYFDTFGFLALPGLLDDVIDEVIEAFEEIWERHGGGHHGQPHDGKRRSCIARYLGQHERLCALLDDPRIHGALSSLVGDDFNYMGSDGNYYAGDTQWHSDGWHPQIRHVKFAFYLDPLTRDTGCLRVIPGSHRRDDGYAGDLRENSRESEAIWGVAGADVPAIALETNPGDVLVFNHNTKHAAFGGGGKRRMFTLNACQRYPEEMLPQLRDYLAGAARFWVDRCYTDTMMSTAGPQRRVHLEQVRANDHHLAELAAKAREEMSEPSRG